MNIDTTINVWSDNLEDEMKKIRMLVFKYPYIAMDTEFPGVVAKPLGVFQRQSGFVFHQLRVNVGLLKLIQLGFTFSDSDGNMPPVCTYQFNFKFDLDLDMYSVESIDLLRRAKLDFEKHKIDGIDPYIFGKLLMTSGLIMNERVYWISLHSAYDFAYLMRIVIGSLLPTNENEFCTLLEALFVNFYDIKYMIKNSKYTKKGLQEIADEFGVERSGYQHQAGSDSLLTLCVFMKMKELLMEGLVFENATVMNKLYGIDCTQNNK